MATRALITGSTGYLAPSVVRALGTEGIRDIRRMFRRERAPPPLPGPMRVEDFQGDLALRADVDVAVRGADMIFHLAAQTSVYIADADPVTDVSSNVIPILNILDACRAVGTRPTVVLAGTATQAGVPKSLPVNESVADDPCTIYDLHKCFAERYVEYFSRAGHVRGTTLRLANVYGPGPPSSRGDRGVLNAMIRKALLGETLQVYGSGGYLRDYVFVDDAARAFTLAAHNPDAVNGRSFVIGTGEGHSLLDAVRLVAELVHAKTGRAVLVEHVPLPAGQSPIETRNFVADPAAFRRATGWAPQFSLRAGVSRTIDDFLAAETIS